MGRLSRDKAAPQVHASGAILTSADDKAAIQAMLTALKSAPFLLHVGECVVTSDSNALRDSMLYNNPICMYVCHDSNHHNNFWHTRNMCGSYALSCQASSSWAAENCTLNFIRHCTFCKSAVWPRTCHTSPPELPSFHTKHV